MTVNEQPKKICLEFVEFPGADMSWLIEKSAAIEAEMAVRLSGAFHWHSVAPYPEQGGFRVFFEIDPDYEGSIDEVAEILVAIIRELASNDLPRRITGDTI